MTGATRIALRLCCLGCVATAALTPIGVARAALMRVGRHPVIPAGAGVGASVSASVPMHVTVTLKPRNAAALAAYAQAVSTPGSIDYRHYLRPAQFAARFGATPAQVAEVRRSLLARGLTPGAASAGRLSIPVQASAGQLERALSISLNRLTLPGARQAAIAAGAAPAFDAATAGLVQAVVGLDTLSAPHPLLARRAPGAPDRIALTPHVATGGPHACAAVQTQALAQSAYSADQIASAYGFSGLYAAGDLGAGVTVAVYELEPDDPADIAAYQECYGTNATISDVPVDGGAGSGPGTGEAALDIENLIGLAPDVRVLVYQGPNAGSGAPGSGPYDTYSAIVNQDRAQVVTVSWGECEALLGQADAIAENTLFEQAAVQGQSIVAAAGDNGSEDCDTGGASGDTSPAVDDPSSQPYVTGVGGTSLQSLGPPPIETVWNSGGGLVSGFGQPGAGGGGVSRFWPMPAAQLDASAALGVREPAAAGTVCDHPGGWCRETPDVSADADPADGYMVYWNGSDASPGQPTQWQGIGGTSAATPVWAAVLALADASPGCSTSPVGYADPALYRAASGSYAADFHDITIGNNDFTGTNGGEYAAAPGYDSASGLGSPDAAALVAGLCTGTVRLANPGPQRSALHAAISLRLRAGDAPGSTLTYRATGLPPGLRLNPGSGQISGVPGRTGAFTVRIGAGDRQGSAAASSFVWIVGGPPRISRLTLTTAASGATQLGLTVVAGHGAPELTALEVELPRELELLSDRGASVTVTAPPDGSPRYGVQIARPSTVTISLAAPARLVRLLLGPPGLSSRAGRMPRSAHQNADRLVLGVDIRDASSGRSRLTAELPR